MAEEILDEPEWSAFAARAQRTWGASQELLQSMRAARVSGTTSARRRREGGSPPEPSRTIDDRFTLEEALGAGAFGSVYRAKDQTEGRQVAIKLLGPDPDRVEADLRQEISALRVLQLPGVVDIVSFRLQGEQPWIAMELVEGSPFPGPHNTDWTTLAPRALSLAEAVQRVHRAGFVHGDLKPDNVLVSDGVSVTLVDFGLARARWHHTAEDGFVSGTPAWFAPEQFCGSPASPATDAFALAMMIYAASPHHSQGPRRCP